MPRDWGFTYQIFEDHSGLINAEQALAQLLEGGNLKASHEGMASSIGRINQKSRLL